MKCLAKKGGIILLLLFVCVAGAYSQTHTARGKVLSGVDQSGLDGVTVQVKGKSAGTTTDVNGLFNLPVTVGDVLVFSYTGFITQEIKVVGTESLTVTLVSAEKGMEEVVVIGYGKRSRRSLTGSVSTVDQKALQSVPITNVGAALQGNVTGLRIQQNTGQPGSTPAISFRGGTNFDGSGAPLVIVDGVIVPSLYGLNPNDIASIDLLKDAASTAIYGARAANGVLLITTKKGTKGKTQVSYDVKTARNYIRRNPVELLSASDYILWNRRSVANRYEAAFLDGNAAEMVTTRNYMSGAFGWSANTAWQASDGKYSTQLVTNGNRHLLQDNRWNLLVDKNPFDPSLTDSLLFLSVTPRQLEDMILQPSSFTEHYVNVSGANDQGHFALGLGTLKDEGILLGSSLSRHSLNFNGGLNIGSRFKLNVNLAGWMNKSDPSYVTADNSGNVTGGVIQRFGGVAPTVRFTDDISGAILPGGDGGTMGNPAYLRDKFKNTTRERRVIGGLNLEYTILPELRLLASASGYMRFWENQRFTKAFQNGTGGAMNTTRTAIFGLETDGQYSYNGFLQYDKSFGGHDISVLAGAEYFEFRSNEFGATGRNAVTDLIPYLSASTEAVGIPTSSFSSWNRLVSGIGRINYDYQNRYLLTINMRYDGTSKLTDNRYGLFPGVSAGWNLHQEEFFRNSKVASIVSTLRPRISWGQNGSLGPVSDFATVPVYNNLGIYNGVTGFGATTLANSALQWEKVSSLNMGVDVGLFNNRITLLADYFVRDVYNKISSLNIPAWTGFGSFTTNLAQLRNKGIELELRANIIRPSKPGGFAWDMGFNFFHVKNYTVKLPDNGLENNRQGTSPVADGTTGAIKQVGGLQQGRRIGNDEVWAPIYDGIYTTNDELAAASNVYNSYLPYNNKYLKLLGDARWRDIDKNDTIDYRDMVFVGRTRPAYQGGFNTTVSYKNFSLYARFDYSLDFVILNQIYMRGMSQVQGSQNGPADIKNTWSPENPGGTLPRYYFGNYGRNYFLESTSLPPANFWEKGDYLALREITLSYSFTPGFLQTKLGNKVKALRAYVSGSDLFYLASYSGTLPEVGGDDVGRFPIPRRITMGLNVTF